MENRRGSGIFLGVIGVATLIVAIIGATFAYFSASAGSGEQQFAGSTTVALGYQTLTDETVFKTKLIPAYDNIAKLGEEAENTAKNGRCVDDVKNEICSVYTFMVGNPSSSVTTKVTSTLVITSNSFENLYFRIYDITDSTKPVEVVTPTNLNKATTTTFTYDGETYTIPVSFDQNVIFDEAGTTLTLNPLSVTLAPSKNEIVDNKDTADKNEINDMSQYVTAKNTDVNGNTNYKVYKVLVWLRDTGTIQPNDTADSFAASINFTTGTGTGVTGQLATAGGAKTNETTGSSTAATGKTE